MIQVYVASMAICRRFPSQRERKGGDNGYSVEKVNGISMKREHSQDFLQWKYAIPVMIR